MKNYVSIATALGLGLMLALSACATPAAEMTDSNAAAEASAGEEGSAGEEAPEPPRIPEDFTWTGRYQVPDLNVEVPFTWHGKDGDFQMVAGGNEHPIHFTNLIHDGQLYTYTYKWPGIPELPCSHVGAFTLEQLNAGLAQAAFAGRETLHRESDYEVNHFRSVSVIDLPSGAIEGIGEDVPVRIPLMAGDIYVDADDPSMLRQLLHFGLQNLYDPNLDEWILIDEHSDEPGEVILPRSCARQS